MPRLTAQVFTEIALSLIPLADAPTWVKALWVEKELEDRGLWQDDVFELVRPFLVSSKGKSEAESRVVPPQLSSLLEQVEPRPEIVVSKPLLSEAEMKWSPQFDDDEDHVSEAATKPVNDDVDRETEIQSAFEQDEHSEPDDVSVPELWQSKLRSENLTIDQAELASAMHLIAVASRLSDDSESEMLDSDDVSSDEPDSELAAAETDLSEVTALSDQDSSPIGDEPEAELASNDGLSDLIPDELIEWSEPETTEAAVIGDIEVPTEDDDEIEPGTTDELLPDVEAEIEIETSFPSEIEDDLPAVSVWSEARKPEEEILAEFETSLDLDQVDEVLISAEELLETADEDHAPFDAEEPSFDVAQWSEARKPEEEILSQFELAEEQLEEHESLSVADSDSAVDDERDLPGIDEYESYEVVLWSENRMPEEEIASQFHVAANAYDAEGAETRAELQQVPVTETDITAMADDDQPEVVVWSESRRPEDEIQSQFEVAASTDDVGEAEPAVELEPVAEVAEYDAAAMAEDDQPEVVLWSETRRPEEEIQSQFEPQLVSSADTKEEEQPAVVEDLSGSFDEKTSEIVSNSDAVVSVPKLEEIAATKAPVERTESVLKKPKRRATTRKRSRVKDLPAVESVDSPTAMEAASPEKDSADAESKRDRARIAAERAEKIVAPAASDDPTVAVRKTGKRKKAAPKIETPEKARKEPVAVAKAKPAAEKQPDKPQRQVLEPATSTAKQPEPVVATKPVKPAAAKQPDKPQKQVLEPAASTEKQPEPVIAAKPAADKQPDKPEKQVLEPAASTEKQPEPAVAAKPAVKPVVVPAAQEVPVSKKSEPEKRPEQQADQDKPQKQTQKLVASVEKQPEQAASQTPAKPVRKPAAAPVQKKSQKQTVAAKAAIEFEKKAQKLVAEQASKRYEVRKPMPGSDKAAQKQTATASAEKKLAATRKSEKSSPRSKRENKRANEQMSAETIAAIRNQLEKNISERRQQREEEFTNAVDAAGIASYYGLHIDNASNEDRAKLMFFSSVLKSQEGDWEGSEERLLAALELLGDSPKSRIWKRAIKDSIRIHGMLDKSAA